MGGYHRLVHRWAGSRYERLNQLTGRWVIACEMYAWVLSLMCTQ